MSNPIDDLSFSDDVLTGDKFLQKEQAQRLAQLFESRCVTEILSHYKIPKKLAYNFSKERHADDNLRLTCLIELLPLLPRFTAYQFQNKVKRVTTLSFEWLEKSDLGEAVQLFGADQNGQWLITDLEILPGLSVVGKREFPLDRHFSGYVSTSLKGDGQCFLICPLNGFLSLTMSKRPWETS